MGNNEKVSELISPTDKKTDKKADKNLDIKLKVFKSKYASILSCLVAVLFMAIYLYGANVVNIAFVTLITAVITDYICLRIARKLRWKKYDMSAIVTGLIVVLLMPATVPIYVPITAVIVSIVIAKAPFGGVGHNIFNPAAVGIAFAMITFPELMVKYPLPQTTYGSIDLVQYLSSPAGVLRVGGTPKIDIFDILLGKFSGPIGATSMILLVCCLLFLLFRNIVNFRIVIPTLAIAGIAAIFFPRLVTGTLDSLVYELSSGCLIFGVVFMASEPTTSPKTKGGSYLYGALLGIGVVLFRYFGTMELSFVYALIFVNALAHPCDQYVRLLKFNQKKRLLKKKRKDRVNIDIAIAD